MTMHRSKYRRLGVLALTAGLLAGSAASAVATTWEVDYAAYDLQQMSPSCAGEISRSNAYADGCFVRNGDKLWIRDTASDSRRVAVQWKLSDGSRAGMCVNTLGYPQEASCDKNFPEALNISIRVGRCDGSTSSCTLASQYTNWTTWITGPVS